jgi:hypothetical protein
MYLKAKKYKRPSLFQKELNLTKKTASKRSSFWIIKVGRKRTAEKLTLITSI